MRHKRSKAYKQMMRKHNKVLKQDYKDMKSAPRDWGIGLEPFIHYMEFMLDYYTLGENVWAEESVDKDGNVVGRATTIEIALEKYNAWMDFMFNKEESVEENNARYNFVRNDFFNYVSEHIEYWWDENY